MALLLSLLFSVLLCLALFAGLRWRNRSINAFPVQETTENPKPLEYYTPMKRLLSEQDFCYVASRPGVSAQVLETFYRQRRRMFRQYLRSLHGDFKLITGGIRQLMVASDVSRADLAGMLLRARVGFVLAMTIIHFRLFLHACGFHGQLFNVGALVDSLAQMHRELASITPVSVMSFQN